MAGTPPWPAGHAKAFDRHDLHCAMHVVPAGGAHQDVLFLDSGRRLQISLSGASLEDRVCLSPLAAPAGAGVTRRAELVLALDHLVAHGRLPRRMHRPEAGAHRLLFILLARDGAQSRVPLRDTALVLFGETRMRDQWKENRRAMRAQMHRAVVRGDWLVAGGYRTLLS
ncbi:MAG: DUF2285 domain-containing protein [Rhizomicrobium sp.]